MIFGNLGKGFGSLGLLGGVSSLSLPNSRFAYFSAMGLWVRNAGGVYTHNYLSANFRPTVTGVTVWVDGVNGSNANSGLTSLLPKKTIASAVGPINSGSASLVHRLVVMSNSLTPYRHQGVNFTKSCVVESWDGSRFVFVGSLNTTAETWAATSGQAGVYEVAAAATPYSVVDLSFTETWGTTDRPAYRRLALVASLVLCQSTPGSWYWDNGATKLYVQTTDSRAPDAKVVPTEGASTFTFVPSASVSSPIWWTDQMDSVGCYNPLLITELAGSGGSGGNANLRAYVNRSTAQICKDIAFPRFGLGNTLSYRVGCYESGDDGFQYNGLNAISNTDPAGSHVEIENATYNCGATTSSQANSTSQHSLSTCVTINPNYQRAWNRDFHDGFASYRWLIGGSIGPSRQSTGATSRSLVAGNASNQFAKIFVDGTTVRPGSLYDLNTTSGCSILFKGSIPVGLTTDPANAGTIGTY